MNFISLQDADFNIIKEYTSKANTNNCEFSVANVYLWNDNTKLKVALIDDILVYRLITNNKAIYSPITLPSDGVAFINKLLLDAKSNNCEFIVNNLSEASIEKLRSAFGEVFDYSYDRGDSDYIYLVSELISLSGPKLHSKKNNLNKFIKNNEFVYETINTDNIEECIKMAWLWKECRPYNNDYEEEYEILKTAFSDYDKYNFLGGLIRIDGEVVAFSFGEQLSNDTFVTHFEKAFDDIPGLYQAINQQFAANTISNFTYVNREDDMGLEGIRRAKLSYKPAILLDKYYLVQKNQVV